MAPFLRNWVRTAARAFAYLSAAVCFSFGSAADGQPFAPPTFGSPQNAGFTQGSQPYAGRSLDDARYQNSRPLEPAPSWLMGINTDASLRTRESGSPGPVYGTDAPMPSSESRVHAVFEPA